MKSNSSPGIDLIGYDLCKFCLGKAGIQFLTIFFNKIFNSVDVPLNWSQKVTKLFLKNMRQKRFK